MLCLLRGIVPLSYLFYHIGSSRRPSVFRESGLDGIYNGSLTIGRKTGAVRSLGHRKGTPCPWGLPVRNPSPGGRVSDPPLQEASRFPRSRRGGAPGRPGQWEEERGKAGGLQTRPYGGQPFSSIPVGAALRAARGSGRKNAEKRAGCKPAPTEAISFPTFPQGQGDECGICSQLPIVNCPLSIVYRLSVFSRRIFVSPGKYTAGLYVFLIL